MLQDIGRRDKIPEALKRAKDKTDSFRCLALHVVCIGQTCCGLCRQYGFCHRLMGFGHRVYKTYDPRAKIMKKVCDQVLEHVGIK